MKKIISIVSLLALLLTMGGCDKEGNYPGHKLSDFIGALDLRSLYQGNDVTLTSEMMFGATKYTGLVVSDHSGNNLPDGLLIVQDNRRLGKSRGISINIGAAAANYQPGDSVSINLVGGVLTRNEGILQITNIAESNVERHATGRPIPLNRVTTAQVLAAPDTYESVLCVIVKGGFNPLPAPTDVFAGNKVLNDGFGEITLYTEADATFANDPLPFNANYYGIFFNVESDNAPVEGPQFRIRKQDDITVLSSVIEIPPVIVSGFISDVIGGDGNYEYIQLLATRDIDFSVTPFSVVATNNANSSTPTGVPVNGWATGGMRTYKFDLTSGTAAKGTYFYVGGASKEINGSGSTSIADANWIRSFNYTNTPGDGFGNQTGGLFANSGNASGVAVFEGTDITGDTKPVDVIFVATGGSIFNAGPPARGYRIANTDWYDVKNPITLEDQPFYRQGTNTICLVYPTPANQGFFQFLGGEYNITLGRWTKARSQTNVKLEKDSPLSAIENAESTKIVF